MRAARRFRLPKALGGGEVRDLEIEPIIELWGYPSHLVSTDDGIEFVIQRRHLTIVESSADSGDGTHPLMNVAVEPTGSGDWSPATAPSRDG